MRGYLSVPGTGSGRISVDSRVEIYRDSERGQEIIARTTEGECELGVRDVTVSRLKDGTVPVVIEPRQSRIEIKNKSNTNGVTVVCDGDRTELNQGLTTTVDDTATITIGYQAKFRLRVEQEAKKEINVSGDVGGDVVAGDQTNVDESTSVVDSVVNRSEISGDGGTTVDDSVVNRSEVRGSPQEDSASDSDTQKRCETHDIMYTGDVCPKCEAQRVATQRGDVETKYCLFCGTTIPIIATVCPECGKTLPEQT